MTIRKWFQLPRVSKTSLLCLVLSLTIGVSANSVVFSFVYVILLQPLPYDDLHNLFVVFESRSYLNRPGNGEARQAELAPRMSMLSQYEFTELKRLVAPSMDLAALYPVQQANLTGVGGPETLTVRAATQDFFKIMRARFVIGGHFAAEARAQDIAVISSGYWKRSLGRMEDVHGQTISIDGRPYLIAGVLEEGFHFLYDEVDAWLPLIPDQNSTRLHDFLVIGRIHEPADSENIARRLSSFQSRLDWLHGSPRGSQGEGMDYALGIELNPLQDYFNSVARSTIESQNTLLVLQTLTAGLLLITLLNVSGVLLAHRIARRDEAFIRRALGATKRAVFGYHLREGITLCMMGLPLVPIVTTWGIQLLSGLVGEDIQRLSPGVGPLIVGLSVLVLIAVGVLVGLGPATIAARTPLTRSIGKKATVTKRERAVLAGLCIFQIGISLALLVAMAVLVQFLGAVGDIDLGFDADGLLLMEIRHTQDRTRGESDSEREARARSQRLHFIRMIEAELTRIAGVESVGAAYNLFGVRHLIFSIDGQDRALMPLSCEFKVVTPGFFQAFEIPVKKGRVFTDQDVDSQSSVAVFSEKAEKWIWPDAHPLGRVRLGTVIRTGRSREIVGIIGDTRHTNLLKADLPCSVFIPMDQDEGLLGSAINLEILVRTYLDAPEMLVPVIREAIRKAFPDQSVAKIGSFQTKLDAQLSNHQMYMTLLGFFSGFSTLLALLGVYGLTSISTTSRHNEFAIRIALGANSRRIQKDLLGSTVAITAAGCLIGCILSVWLSSLLAAELTGLGTPDLTTILGSAGLLTAFTGIATIPSIATVAKLQPTELLRQT